MASLYHHMVSRTDLSYGTLPPSREGLLEIQVSKLINDYLFSDSEERSSPASVAAFEANADSDFALKAAAPLPSSQEIKACNVDADRSRAVGTQVYASREKTRSGMGSCTEQGSHISGIADNISSSAAAAAAAASAPASASALLSSPSKCMQECYRSKSTEEKRVSNTVQLARLSTFPCKSGKIEGKDDNLEVKSNSRKPPRPPNRLTRCSSDTMLLHNSRRLKMERRKKSIAGSGANSSDTSTSLWALIFTVLFAIVMLAQGLGGLQRDGGAVLAVFPSNDSPSTMKPDFPNEVTAVEGRRPYAKGNYQSHHELMRLRRMLFQD